MTTPTGNNPPISNSGQWRAEFKDELQKLAHSYWVVKQPINPQQFQKVVADINLQCQAIFSRIGSLNSIDESTSVLNYLAERNEEVISRFEILKSKVAPADTAQVDASIEKLLNIQKKVMDVALDIVVAQEEWDASLLGRVSNAAIEGTATAFHLSAAIPIIANAAINLSNDMINLGVNQLAAAYMPRIASQFSPSSLFKGRVPDLKTLAQHIFRTVTENTASSIPVIGESRRVRRTVTRGTRKLTSFDEKIFEPLQAKLLTLTSEGNFQLLLGHALSATARCIELYQIAEKQPGTIKERQQFLIQRLLPDATLENYEKRMKERRKAGIGRLLGSSDEQNIASKVVKELLSKLSEFAGVTDLVLVTAAETLTQSPMHMRKLPDHKLGDELIELRRKVERETPIVADLLTVTGGWQKLQALPHYADIASLYIQNQILEQALSILSTPASTTRASRNNFQTTMENFIDTAHHLATDDKTWDQYWLRLFSRLPKQQLLKRVEWNAQLVEPLRQQWHGWIKGS